VSLARTTAVVLSLAIAVLVVWRQRDPAGGPGAAAPTAVAPTAPTVSSGRVDSAATAAVPGAARAPTATPSLPDGPPFREQDFAVTGDGPDAPLLALRASARDGRSLSVELGTREPSPDGKRVFATVSVSDALGNTLIDCTWRDVDVTDDARKLDCELPADVALPLTISGHQRSAPSFIETPAVVAIDKGVHP
jgi:hypothetical protein